MINLTIFIKKKRNLSGDIYNWHPVTVFATELTSSPETLKSQTFIFFKLNFFLSFFLFFLFFSFLFLKLTLIWPAELRRIFEGRTSRWIIFNSSFKHLRAWTTEKATFERTGSGIPLPQTFQEKIRMFNSIFFK